MISETNFMLAEDNPLNTGRHKTLEAVLSETGQLSVFRYGSLFSEGYKYLLALIPFSKSLFFIPNIIDSDLNKTGK